MSNNVVLNHRDVVSDIVGSLGAVDPETLCTIYQLVNEAELVYIGDDEFELLDCEQEDEDDYGWDCIDDEDDEDYE